MHIITAVFLFTEPSSIGQRPFAELPKAANTQPHSNQQLQDSEEKEGSSSDRSTVMLFREFKLLIFDLVDTALHCKFPVFYLILLY